MNDLQATLRRRRATARAALGWERAWRAAWAPACLLGLYAAASLLELPQRLSAWPRLLLPGVIVVLAVFLLVRGLRRTAPAGAAEVDRRLERDSGLRHRPLAALADTPAAAGPEATAVWQVHRRRLLDSLGALRVRRPRPGVARHDRTALRLGAAVALAAGLMIAGSDAPARLREGLLPPLPAMAPPGPAPLVQAWVTPPPYTGQPPALLVPGRATSLPTGTRLTVSVTGGSATGGSVTGGSGAPTLALDNDGTEFQRLGGESWQAERTLTASGQLRIRHGGDLATWSLTIVPDRPPSVAFTEPPGPAQAGGRTTLQTRLAWRAEDDYGVTSVEARLSLQARPGAPPLVVPAPLTGTPKQAKGAAVQDLTAHPWAGLPVDAAMVARDAAGQEGRSEPATLTLPERPFETDAARAVIAIRRQLSLTPEARTAGRAALDGLAERTDLYDGAPGVLLNLRAAGALLAYGRGQAAVDEVQARLWELALALEEGQSDRTARALELARQAVRDAMDATRADPQNAEKQAELEKKMAELREAIQRHIDALLDQSRRDNADLPFDPSSPQMNARDLDRMAREAEKSAREGRPDDAQKQMAELERLLEQLQNARPESGEKREQRNAERRQQGKQQTDAVQDLVRREGGLLDRSQARADPTPRRPETPPQPGSPGQRAQDQAAPDQRAPDQRAPDQRAPDQRAQDQRVQDQKAQAAMRRALGELMQRFGDLTGQVPAPLSEADTAMREAGQAMAEGRDGPASQAQQRAIEALQKGGKQMGQQLARQFGRGQQEGEGEGDEGSDGTEMADGDGQPGGPGQREGQGRTEGPPRPGEQNPNRRRNANRDPLGRPLPPSVGGTEESGSTRVPDQMEEARTRAIQDELRRRGADRTRPQPELDYIDRLLKTY